MIDAEEQETRAAEERLGLSPATAETATPLTVPGGRPD
jgi:hypothetical protein